MPHLTGAKHACKLLTILNSMSKTRLGYIEQTEHKQAATSSENTGGRPASAASSAADDDDGDVGMSWCPRPEATNRIPESSIRAPTQAGRLMRGGGGARRVRSSQEICEFAITPTSPSTTKQNEQPELCTVAVWEPPQQHDHHHPQDYLHYQEQQRQHYAPTMDLFSSPAEPHLSQASEGQEEGQYHVQAKNHETQTRSPG